MMENKNVVSDKMILVTRSSLPPFEEYVNAIRPLWDSHWLTNMGVYHQQLENELKDFLDVPEFSLMVNGHMALELVIQAFGFPEGSEVITTPFTFISTTHAIVRNRLRPIFCDVKLTDGTIDETKIENLITEKTVAILPVHVYGNVCNIEEIQRIAGKHNLKVIYDAAHAFGVKYKGKGIGSYGDASIFSFHATKVYNTIEGGGVAFWDHALYEKLYNLKNFGIQGEELVTDIGANAKMNEFSAIMGLCNLRHFGKAVQGRKECFELYHQNLGKMNGIRFFDRNPDSSLNYSYLVIITEERSPVLRDRLYDFLKEYNIYTRKYFCPLTSDQECFKGQYQDMDLRCARQLAGQVLVLPLYETLPLKDVERICLLIGKFMDSY